MEADTVTIGLTLEVMFRPHVTNALYCSHGSGDPRKCPVVVSTFSGLLLFTQSFIQILIIWGWIISWMIISVFGLHMVSWRLSLPPPA